MVTYRQHKNAENIRVGHTDCGITRLHLDCRPDLETFVDFDTFLTFHNADPDGWWLNTDFGIPYYVNTGGYPRCIKFVTRRDFRKFKKWTRQRENDKESEQNLKEQSELALMVRKAAAKRTEAAIKEQKKAEAELQEIVDGIARIAQATSYKVATISTGQFRDETVPAKTEQKKKKEVVWEYDPWIGEFTEMIEEGEEE